MENLKKIALFQDIAESDLKALLTCLSAQEKCYKKDDFLLQAGDPAFKIGIVMDGTVQVTKEDLWGNRTIVAELTLGQLFAEVFAWVGLKEIPVTVVAKTDCKVLWLPVARIVGTCSAACDFHHQLVKNMLRVIAKKNMMLNAKLDLLSQRSTKEKLLNYFYTLAEEQEAMEFTIPFNRNELADFLCVDRSAMSRELGRMQREGLLTFKKNHFHIYHPPLDK